MFAVAVVVVVVAVDDADGVEEAVGDVSEELVLARAREGTGLVVDVEAAAATTGAGTCVTGADAVGAGEGVVEM